MSELKWYAVAVKPRHEKSASLAFTNKGLESFLPLYQKHHRYRSRARNFELPVFPGYVFCRFDISRCLPVLGTPGVIQILGCGRSPVPLEDEEILSLQTVAGRKLAMQPCPFVREGATVLIKEGPLAGVRGTVMRVQNMVRVVLSVTLLMRSVYVEVDAECLAMEPENSAASGRISSGCITGTPLIHRSKLWVGGLGTPALGTGS